VEATDPSAQRHAIEVPEGTPRTERVPGGTVYRPQSVFHTVANHYCYPSPGISLELDTPVVQCNRYSTDPMAAASNSVSINVYRDRLAAWEEARIKEADEAAQAERVIAESLNLKETP